MRKIILRIWARFPVFRGPLTLGLFARKRSKILACGNHSIPARITLRMGVDFLYRIIYSVVTEE